MPICFKAVGPLGWESLENIEEIDNSTFWYSTNWNPNYLNYKATFYPLSEIKNFCRRPLFQKKDFNNFTILYLINSHGVQVPAIGYYYIFFINDSVPLHNPLHYITM